MGKYRSRFIRSVYPNLDPSPQLSYVIGVIIGDGCVSKYDGKYSIILNVTDKPFALCFQQALQRLGLHPWVTSGLPKAKRKRCFRVTAMSNIFGEWFNSLRGDKISVIASSYPIDFLRGFYESEGTASPKRVCLVNTELWKVELAKELVESAGFRSSLYNYPRLPPAKTAYELHIIGGKAERLKFLTMINPCIKGAL